MFEGAVDTGAQLSSYIIPRCSWVLKKKILVELYLILQIADFWKEAQILSSLHHPNVVSFYGVVRDGPDGSLATVTEFMVNGSLKQFLRKKDRY